MPTCFVPHVSPNQTHRLDVITENADTPASLAAPDGDCSTAAHVTFNSPISTHHRCSILENRFDLPGCWVVGLANSCPERKTAWKEYLRFLKKPSSDKYRIRGIGVTTDMWQQQPNNGDNGEYYCRQTVESTLSPESRPMPLGSESMNTTLPCLTVDSITWDQRPWPTDVFEIA